MRTYFYNMRCFVYFSYALNSDLIYENKAINVPGRGKQGGVENTGYGGKHGFSVENMGSQ